MNLTKHGREARRQCAIELQQITAIISTNFMEIARCKNSVQETPIYVAKLFIRLNHWNNSGASEWAEVQTFENACRRGCVYVCIYVFKNVKICMESRKKSKPHNKMQALQNDTSPEPSCQVIAYIHTSMYGCWLFQTVLKRSTNRAT